MEGNVCVRTTENLGSDSKIRRNQYIAGLLVGVLSFSQGSFTGWVTAVLPPLQSEDTSADFQPIDDEEASWIGSVSSLSSVFAIPLWSYSVDKLGRKITGYMAAMPFIVCWVLTLCANSISMMYAARCIGGLSAGGSGIIVTTYTTDVAEDDVRGLLGTIYSITMYLGTLYGCAVGSYLSYTWFNISCLVQPVIFLVTFFWLPESPLFLLIKGKELEAKKALSWLRNGRDVEKEFVCFKQRAEDFVTNKQNKISMFDITARSTYRALLICLGLMTNLLLSGSSPIITYAVNIFQVSGSSLSANVSTIILVALLALSTIVSSFVVEESGRRILLISSNILSAASLVLLGVFFYLKNIGSDVASIQWLPLTSLAVFILCIGFAITPIPFFMTTELPSPQARGLIQSVSIIFVSAGVFLTTKTFTSMSNAIGTYGCFWFYGISCAVSAVVIYFTVPETKGRSSEDIVAQLNSGRFISSVISRKQELPVEMTNKTDFHGC